MNSTGYAVTWCETDADGKRVKRREEYTQESVREYMRTSVWYETPQGLAQRRAQRRAAKLRNCGYAACVEEIK